MARTLDSFPDEAEQVARGRYPWSKWLDGKPWELEKGTPDEVKAGTKDFHVACKSFTSAAKQAARSRNGSVRAATLDDAVVIQFVPDDTQDSGE
jgi:hypothetical protein